MRKISVIGLGKLGLPLLGAVASCGYKVIGVDVSTSVVDTVKKAKSYIFEPGVDEILRANKERIDVTMDTVRAVEEADITFIVTQTPSLKNGGFSIKYVKQVAREVAKAIKEKKEYQLFVLVSTVLPGSTQKVVTLIERESGRVCGVDFGFCYNPEFIALGSVLHNLFNPDFLLIGESDKRAGDILENFYKTFCKNDPKVARMNFVNAEITKISLNTFVTTKISYANMLSDVCETLEGADVDVVSAALGLDQRIGSKCLKGGTSFGGPCFPRDNVAFLNLARKKSIPAKIVQATHETNQWQNQKLSSILKSLCVNKKSLGILGVSYKSDTDVVTESPSYHVIKNLVGDIQINVYDPKSLNTIKEIFGQKIKYYSSIKKCVINSDIILISTLWEDIKNINLSLLKSDKLKVVVDPWRIFKNAKFPSNVVYIPLGMHSHLTSLLNFLQQDATDANGKFHPTIDEIRQHSGLSKVAI